MTLTYPSTRVERFTGIASLHAAGYDPARIAFTLGLSLHEVIRYIERLEARR